MSSPLRPARQLEDFDLKDLTDPEFWEVALKPRFASLRELEALTKRIESLERQLALETARLEKLVKKSKRRKARRK